MQTRTLLSSSSEIGKLLIYLSDIFSFRAERTVLVKLAVPVFFWQVAEISESLEIDQKKRVRFEIPKSPNLSPAVREELMELIEAKEAGVAYVLGHSYVKAKRSSSLLKKFAIDVAYTFLRRNCRGPSVALSVPHLCLIEVGMIYYV
jgi:KUP system potassium uptake protein